MDQGSTVNTANDNNKLLPLRSPHHRKVHSSGVKSRQVAWVAFKLVHMLRLQAGPLYALMSSHIPSNYGYMFLGWEKIGVRLRYARWLTGRNKEKIASLFLLHPFPWVPTHLNLTSIFFHPQKHIPVNRDRVQVCRGPVEVVACPPILLYSPET